MPVDVSQIKLAYTYDGAFVGRLVFELKANATAKGVSYTCCSAGGKAVSLLPNSADYAITKLNVGCAPLPAIEGGSSSSGRRRLRAAVATSGPGLGLSAGTFGAVAAPLAVLPVDPLTGVPLTAPIGDVLVPGGTPPGPSPPPPGPPGPSPPPPPGPAVPPTVSLTTTTLLINSNTLLVTGTNFDASNSASNIVVLSNGAAGVVASATSTTLTITLTKIPTNTGEHRREKMGGRGTTFFLSGDERKNNKAKRLTPPCSPLGFSSAVLPLAAASMQFQKVP